jgi:hypothetical protein
VLRTAPDPRGPNGPEVLPTSAGHWVGARSCRTRASTRRRSGPVTRPSASMLRLTSLLSRARITSSPALSQPGLRTPLARCATRASRAPIGPAQSSRARGANSTAKRHASVRATSMLKRTITSSCRPPIRSSSPIQDETSAMSCSTRVMSDGRAHDPGFGFAAGCVASRVRPWGR